MKKHWTKKLREENQILRAEILELVVRPGSMASERIRGRVVLQDSMEKSVMFGSCGKSLSFSQYEGIFSAMVEVCPHCENASGLLSVVAEDRDSHGEIFCKFCSKIVVPKSINAHEYNPKK